MSVKKVNGKWKSKWKIFLLLTMYYAVSNFLILELYVVCIASRHGRYFQEKAPAEFFGYEARL